MKITHLSRARSNTFSGAKMFVETAAGLTELAGGGMAWDGIEYDTDNYIQAYGSDPETWFDPDAIVFKLPSDGIYWVSGVIWPVGNTNGSVARMKLQTDHHLFPRQDIREFGMILDTNHISMLPSTVNYVGALTLANDDIIGWGPSWAVAAGSPNIAEGSWLAIERLGDIPA